jgi:putative transposase
MPRKPRFYLPGVACHVVQRGVGGSPCFLNDTDHNHFLECLHEAAIDYGCQIHAYVLMPNHYHLLLTPQTRDSASRMMQSLGRRYVQLFNKEHGRHGTLWEGRYRASLVEDGEILLDCQRYIELNPVRAALVDKPGDHRWSSFQWHGLGRRCRVLTDHASFRRLGENSAERQLKYVGLVESAATTDTPTIRRSVNSGMPLGSRGFCRKVESELSMKLGYSRRGRPSKTAVKQYPPPGYYALPTEEPA